jgi:hypothetical protein
LTVHLESFDVEIGPFESWDWLRSVYRSLAHISRFARPPPLKWPRANGRRWYFFAGQANATIRAWKFS